MSEAHFDSEVGSAPVGMQSTTEGSAVVPQAGGDWPTQEVGPTAETVSDQNKFCRTGRVPVSTQIARGWFFLFGWGIVQ